MRNTSLLWAALVALGSIDLASGALGYDLNPAIDRYRSNTGKVFSSVKDNVHEDITHAAITCANDSAIPSDSFGIKRCDVSPEVLSAGDRGNFYTPLIRGVWWNDDPNQLLNSVHYATFLAYMDDAESIAKTGKNIRGLKREINPTYKMQYRSHFGDLQFLHAMANDSGDGNAQVQRRMLDWAQFAYSVAIGDIATDKRLADVDLPATRKFFVSQPGWTVSYLFAPKYKLAGDTIPDVALGSVLHMIQDSFAVGHTDRIDKPSIACPYGNVATFHDYASQDTADHAAGDTRSALRNRLDSSAMLNPVQTSARMVELARAKASWDSAVAPFLEKVFCTAST